MQRRLLVSLLISVVTIIAAAEPRNRTSCFQYLSCLEATQAHFKQCAGGTGVSLTLEAKDVNIQQLIRYRALEFIGCQDRLLKEILDFDALQILVNEDARECFEKLPESSRRVEGFSDSCDYVRPVKRDLRGRDAFQCLLDYKQDREYCETLLECCPDHIRCGERMNAVSVAYQAAKDKSNQIVTNMLFCIVSNDPRFRDEGNRLQQLRDPYRNSGIPFLRPDRVTEERILRRLSLTSQSSLLQRKTRFEEKYRDVRKKLQQKLQQFYATTQWPLASPQRFEEPNGKSPASVIDSKNIEESTKVEIIANSTETSTEAVPVVEATTTTAEALSEEDQSLAAAVVIEEPANKTDDETAVEKSIESIAVEVTTTEAPSTTEEIPEINTERKIAIIKNLLRTVSDSELSSVVTLIAEANFKKLAEIEAAKTAETTETKDKIDANRVEKIRGAIKEALKSKKVKTLDFLDIEKKKLIKGGEDLDSKDFTRRSIDAAPSDTKLSERTESAGNLAATIVQPATEENTNTTEVEKKVEKESEEKKENTSEDAEIAEATTTSKPETEVSTEAEAKPAEEKTEEKDTAVKSEETKESTEKEKETTEKSTEAEEVTTMTTTTTEAPKEETKTEEAASVEKKDELKEEPKEEATKEVEKKELPEAESQVKAEEVKENGGEIVEEKEEKTTTAAPEADVHSAEIAEPKATVTEKPQGLPDDSKEKPYLKSSEETTTAATSKSEESKSGSGEIPEIRNVTEFLHHALHSRFVAFGRDSKLKEAKLRHLSFASDRTITSERPARKLKEPVFNKEGNELNAADFETAETAPNMAKPKVPEGPKPDEFEVVTPKSAEVREKLLNVEKEIKAVKDIVVPTPDPDTQLKVVDEISKIVNGEGTTTEAPAKPIADLPIQAESKEKTEGSAEIKEPVETVKPTTSAPEVSTELPAVTTEGAKLSGAAESLMSELVEHMKQSTQNSTNETEAEVSTKSPAVHDDAKLSDEAPSVDDVLLTSASLELDEGSGDEAPHPIKSSKTDKKEVVEPIGDLLHSKNVTRTYCKEFANCWETLQIYEEQCEKRYSKDILNHGIEEPEIVQLLLNSSLSKNSLVLRACLKPLDKNAYSMLKQLLVIQRGVRKACLEFGRNKIPVTSDEEAQCGQALPSTEAIDDFFTNTHVRSQANHLTCFAKLVPLRESCRAISSCCASVDTCDSYIQTSPVKKMQTEALQKLVHRQNECEQRMLDTLNYIHTQFGAVRRRRF